MRAADGALLIVALAIAWSLVRVHRDPTTRFDLMDLIMENGRVSRIAFAFLTTLVVTSWIVIRMTLDKKMTDVAFAAYGAMWVAPILAKIFGPTANTTTTDIRTHETKTETKA